MEKDKWIEDALKSAKNTAEEAKPIIERIDSFLEAYEPRVLDSWKERISEETFLKVARWMMSEDDIHNAVMALAHTYLTAGYCLAKQYYENKE